MPNMPLDPRRPFISPDKDVLDVLQQMVTIALTGAGTGLALQALWNRYRRNLQRARDPALPATARVEAQEHLHEDYEDDIRQTGDPGRNVAAGWLHGTLRVLGAQRLLSIMDRGPQREDIEMANREEREREAAAQRERDQRAPRGRAGPPSGGQSQTPYPPSRSSQQGGGRPAGSGARRQSVSRSSGGGSRGSGLEPCAVQGCRYAAEPDSRRRLCGEHRRMR